MELYKIVWKKTMKLYEKQWNYMKKIQKRCMIVYNSVELLMKIENYFDGFDFLFLIFEIFECLVEIMCVIC